MAKSKYAPALFEVINRQKNTGTLGVPKWWNGAPGPQPGEAGPEAAAPAPAEPLPQDAARDLRIAPETPMGQVAEAAPVQAPRLVPAMADEARPSVEHEEPPLVAGRFPGFRFESGRLHLVLSPTHAAVACGALLILLVGFFQIGRSTGSAAPTPGTDTSMSLLAEKPANSGVLDKPTGKSDVPPARAALTPAKPGLAEAMGDTKPTQSAQEDLSVGLHYVLLDKYPRDALKTAEFVHNWLASTHQIPTVLRERKDSYWLISKTGFDFAVSGESQKCDQFVERIKALGKDCRKELIRAELPVYGFASPMKFKLEK